MIEVIDEYHLSLLEPEVVARYVGAFTEDEPEEGDDEVETKVIRRGRPPKAAKATEGAETK